MKIGIICEGAIDSDFSVFEYLIQQIDPTIEVVPNPLINKEDIINNCGKVVKSLFEIEECNKILIIWDLNPSWSKERACLYSDRNRIFDSLDNNGLISFNITDEVIEILKEHNLEQKIIDSLQPNLNNNLTKKELENKIIDLKLSEKDKKLIMKHSNQLNKKNIFLISIKQMLEAWLIADETAIQKLLSTKTYTVKVSAVKRPEHQINPKVRIIKEFEKSKGRTYIENRHALEIIKLANIKKLSSCPTYERFEEKVKNKL